MEATTQPTQRKITLESLDLVQARCPRVHLFNELLVQFAVPRRAKLGQVVPDNMVVLSERPIDAELSFNVPLQPAPPFWVLECVSKNNRRKDYDTSFKKYERQLKVPSDLRFAPNTQELTLYRHNGQRYERVPCNERERCAIPEIDIEVGLLNGWVRFWYQRRLLPLPDELQRELDRWQRLAKAESRREDDAVRRADDAIRRVETAERELAELRAQMQHPQKRSGNGSQSSKYHK